ncbi:hypothetical protein [Parvularcula sp. IMCC14364]|uniref:hypothetical protein n=1 Tax=Parvularcula sp. IMCC14364 TaxID=3067902 RepID=UPI002741DE43|nr:hypothetical protein [Parvularcula sp. IMCC14364]
MTTIITVHGTNAGDESDAGEQWWQQGSAFQENLSEYVEAPDGRLTFKPFHWGIGPNSELKRRDAGNDLRREMLALEKEGEPYSVIGHSHGGSVLTHALFSAYAKKLSLPNMKSWVTVGTPFIDNERTSFILKRFNLFGQIGIAIAVIQILGLISIPFISWFMYGTFMGASAGLIFAAFLLLASVAFFAISFTARARKRQNGHHKKNFAEQYQKKWSSFRHHSDEAIEGLKNIQNVRISIVKALPIARTISTYIAYALILIWSAHYFFLNLTAAQQYNDQASIDVYSVQELCGEIQACKFIDTTIIAIDDAIFRITEPLWTLLPVGANAMENAFVYPLAMILLIIASYFVLSGIFTIVLMPLIALINGGLSARVRAISVGGDAYGEELTVISSKPNPEYTHDYVLPGELASEIEDYTEQYAIDAIRKIRALIGSNIASSDNPITDQISDTLSWKELIHTAYFDVDNFIKLVAVSLCESGLVTPSAKLKNDPDYTKVLGWYKEMKHGPDA